MTLWPFLIPAILAASGALALRRSPWAQRLLDRPNERSLHTAVTPRVGGIALMAGAVPVALAYSSGPLAGVLGLAVALAIVSTLDDAHSLPVKVRLAAHFLAAIGAAVLLWPAGEAPALVARLLCAVAVLGIAWMTNLFNFMDGADGLAGGMAAIGFGALSIAAWQAGAWPLAACCLSLASASAGFLLVNFPPARVFMGDAGSIPLGFLAGALGLAGILSDAWTWWYPIAVFSPFILDASLTLLRRLARGAQVWRAHREHAYQRLVLHGWSKRELALKSYAAIALTALAATAALRQEGPGRYAIISALAAGWMLLLAAIEWRCRKAPSPDQETPASGFGP